MEKPATSKIIIILLSLLIFFQILSDYYSNSAMNKLLEADKNIDIISQSDLDEIRLEISALKKLYKKSTTENNYKKELDSLKQYVQKLESDIEKLRKNSTQAKIEKSHNPSDSAVPDPDPLPLSGPKIKLQRKQARFSNSAESDAFVALLPEGSQITMVLKSPDGGISLEYLIPEKNEN